MRNRSLLTAAILLGMMGQAAAYSNSPNYRATAFAKRATVAATSTVSRDVPNAAQPAAATLTPVVQIVPRLAVSKAVVTSTWRVVAGGQAHTDCQGNVWSADSNFSGGTAATSTNNITGALPCTTDGALYQDQRYGSPFTYSFAEPAGSYQVTLKFAETYWTAAGQRVFNVSINGNNVLTNFDIFKTTGAQNKGIDEVFNNITSAGAAITITFGPASVNYAMVQAIQVIPQPNLLPTNTASATPTPTSTASPTATFTYTSTPTGFTAAAGGAWVNEPFAVQAGDFTASFDAMISASPNNAVVALSNGVQTAYTSFAALVRFNTLGDIDAYNANAGGYAASTTIPFAAGTTYHFTLQIHMAAQTYDISVSQGGGASQVVGTGFKFRVAASSLNNYGLFVNAGGSGNLTVDHFTIGIPPTATPTSTSTPTASFTATSSATSTFTATDTGTSTNTRTVTPTNTATSTGTSTFTPTSTNSPTATPTRTSTSSSTPTPAGQTTWRVNADGPQYTDIKGNVWLADQNFSGGTAAGASTSAISGTSDGALYQTQRYGTSFSYAFQVPAGSYQVTLKFAETYWTAAGQRSFNASINGTVLLTNFDIFASAGGQNIALDKAFNNISPVNGMITISFGPASVDNACIQAIQIIPQGNVTQTPTATFTTTVTGPPNFGPNVILFDPSMSSSTIQSKIDNIYSQQKGNQFGSARYALLFKPGTYTNTVSVGYYTQALGLGASPNDVQINGSVVSNAALANGNATCNFWESAENLAVSPSGGTDKWAVSQACPMRRMHIKGGIVLSDSGSQAWSSGGFLGDSLVDGQVNSGSQQQWLSRNDQWGSWAGSNWNMVFVGNINSPSGAGWPNPPNTVVTQTPLVREKPFLRVDSNGNYSVFVPALRTNSTGTSWSSGTAAGTSIPISQFYIAQASIDTASTLNAALAAGKNLLLTPGVYSLTAPLQVNNANTVVLGLGLATLLAQNGTTAMKVADVDGVTIAGILFDAGSVSSPILLQVGPTGSSASHVSNPTLLADLFFRIGGAAVGKAVISLQINSNNVIGDDFWIWRADHSNGVGWTTNTAQTGLVVNGTNVTIYGLACEHFQQYQSLWNGNGGAVYFYQSEDPYDVPNQASWMDGSKNGYASYKVADSVTSHKAYGLGIYCYFTANGSVAQANAIEVPTSGLAGAMCHNMTTVELGGSGNGSITNIIDGYGPTANSGTAVHLAQ